MRYLSYLLLAVPMLVTALVDYIGRARIIDHDNYMLFSSFTTFIFFLLSMVFYIIIFRRLNIFDIFADKRHFLRNFAIIFFSSLASVILGFLLATHI